MVFYKSHFCALIAVHFGDVDYGFRHYARQQFSSTTPSTALRGTASSYSLWTLVARRADSFYAIARYLSRSRAVNCEPEQVLIVNGTQQALYLIMRLLLEPHDVIALVDPGYLSARLIFLNQSAKLLPVAVDESGLVVKDLAYSTEQIRLVYLTPSHQFPTGAILSLPRRLELLAWAQEIWGKRREFI